MADSLDGCPEFDARVLDAAFDPVPDPAVAAHLARCARCRAAGARYARAGAVLSGGPVPPLTAEPAPRGLGPVLGAVGAGLLLVGGLWIAGLGRAEFSIEAGPRARVRMVEGRRARVESGTARFQVHGARAVVETPRGEVRAEDAEFDVTVDHGVTPGSEDRDGGDAMTGTQRAGAAVTVAVVAGVVWWMASDGPEEVPAGRTVTRTMPAAPAMPPRSGAPAPSPDVASEPVPAPRSGPVLLGRVVDDATGEPVVGARVRLGFHFIRTGREPETTTGPDGRFRMEGLPGPPFEGECLRLESPEHASTIADSIGGWQGRLREGEPLDLGEFRIARGAAVAGTVVAVDGTPVAGAQILFCRETRQSYPPTFHPAGSEEAVTCDAAGRFRIPRVAPAAGEFRHTLFAVSDAGFGWLELPGAAGKRDVDGLEVRFAPVAAIDVLVRGAGGAPVVGARVTAEPHFRPLGQDRGDPAPAHDLYIGPGPLLAVFSTTTGADGRARLPRLPVDGASCTYDVVARAGERGEGWKDGVVLTPGARAEVVVDLALRHLVAVSGTVRDGAGKPIEGAEVSVMGLRARTDAQGGYRVEGIDPGASRFEAWATAEADGFARAIRVFPVAAGIDATGIDFALGPPRMIRGRVVDEQGVPVMGVGVTLLVLQPDKGPRGEPTSTRYPEFGVESVQSDAEGRFTLRSASGGQPALRFHPPPPIQEWQVPARIEVEGDAEVTAVIKRAPRGTRVVLDVVDALTGDPLEVAKAEKHAVDWRSVPSVFGFPPKTDRGIAVFERVPAGDWVFWVLAVDRGATRLVLRVEEGSEEVRATVRCAATGAVHGVVEGGAPPPGRKRMVFLRLADGSAKPQWLRLASDPQLIDAAWVEADGTFRVEGLPSAPVLLWLEEPGWRGDLEVQVPPGGVAQAVLRVHATARVRFQTAGPCPTEMVFLRTASAEGKWERWTRWHGQSGKTFESTRNAIPGRLLWQVKFREKGESADEGAPDAEGEVATPAGETAEVEIPLPTR